MLQLVRELKEAIDTEMMDGRARRRLHKIAARMEAACAAASEPPPPVAPAAPANPCPQRGCPQTDGLPCSFPCCPMRRPKRTTE